MRTLIIAEAGVNHNGDLNLAKRLVDIAELAGADFVKFQTFTADNLAAKDAPKAEYQKKNFDNGGDYQFNILKKLELSKEDHFILVDYCKDKKVKFLSSAFDLESLDFLVELGIDLFKIPSGEITNLPYLQKISKLKGKVILSTGMANMEEIKMALNVLASNGKSLSDIVVLHCNTDYPTKFSDVNLLAMNTIAKECDVVVGYSDHTLGIEIPIAAVALGAKVIEKHFTIDKKLPGPDHVASLEPEELINMVKSIRHIEEAMGNGVKKPSSSEMNNIEIVRKSLFLKTALASGHILTEGDFLTKRPGNGISPMDIPKIIGKKLLQNVGKGEMFGYSMVKANN